MPKKKDDARPKGWKAWNTIKDRHGLATTLSKDRAEIVRRFPSGAMLLYEQASLAEVDSARERVRFTIGDQRRIVRLRPERLFEVAPNLDAVNASLLVAARDPNVRWYLRSGGQLGLVFRDERALMAFATSLLCLPTTHFVRIPTRDMAQIMGTIQLGVGGTMWQQAVEREAATEKKPAPTKKTRSRR